MSFARSVVRRSRLCQPAQLQIENLERRLLLSSAIAAFGASQSFHVGAFPAAAVAADLNGDGKIDLVSANEYGTDSISVLLGNGNGTFTPQQTFAAGVSRPKSVVVADVNRDGQPDLVVGGDFGSDVSVLLGNGDGTFQAPRTFDFGGVIPSPLDAADVNGDGKIDLLALNRNTVSLLLGNGDGTFQPAQTFDTGSGGLGVAFADVNQYGKLDLLIANNSDPSSVSVLLGNGDGTFQAPQTFATGSSFSWYVAASDLNGDGHTDLVVANQGGNNVSVLLGNGDGSFKAPETFAVASRPYSLVVSDVIGDGRPDIVTANARSNSVSVLLGNGDGTFQSQKTFATAFPTSVVAADVNGDGRVDLVVANAVYPGTVSVLLGDVPPTVLSMDRNTGPFTSDSSASYTVVFNEPVTGVDPTDFSLVLTGDVTATTPVVVSGSGADYTVTVNGISGAGTLGLNLLDDGSIQDVAGNPLQPGGTVEFASQGTISVGPAQL